jgi:hypothetical protein
MVKLTEAGCNWKKPSGGMVRGWQVRYSWLWDLDLIYTLSQREKGLLAFQSMELVYLLPASMVRRTVVGLVLVLILLADEQHQAWTWRDEVTSYGTYKRTRFNINSEDFGSLETIVISSVCQLPLQDYWVWCHRAINSRISLPTARHGLGRGGYHSNSWTMGTAIYCDNYLNSVFEIVHINFLWTQIVNINFEGFVWAVSWHLCKLLRCNCKT